MPRSMFRFLVLLAVFIVGLAAIPLASFVPGAFLVGILLTNFLVAFPLLLLFGRDAMRAADAKAVREQGRGHLLVLAGLPTLILGIVGVAFGTVILGWGIYRLWLGRQPASAADIAAGFGTALAMIVFGVRSIKRVGRAVVRR